MTPTPAAPNVVVDSDDRQQACRVDVGRLSALLAATLHDLTVERGTTAAGAEVGLAFVDVDEMTELNELHMGGSGPTDVLAFPIDGGRHSRPAASGQPIMYGDIVICPAAAAKAPQPLGDELALLVVHGALHLVGHDHAEPAEAQVMKALEAQILTRHYESADSIGAVGITDAAP